MIAAPATGLFAGVCGASGVGKDTVLSGARSALASRHDILFVRRTITRPADAGGEDHEAVTEQQFVQLERDGAFCLSWRAHGLAYGVPSTVTGELADGCTVVCNISRAAALLAAGTFPNFALIEITADPAIIAARLAARGRETQHEILLRQTRKVGDWNIGITVHQIANNKEPDEAVNGLVTLLLNLSGQNARSA